MKIKPTLKEIKILDSAKVSMLSLLISAITLTIIVAYKPTTPTVLEYRQPTAAIVTRSMNTGVQISQYRDAFVSYSVQITSNLTLTGGQSGTVNLQTSPNNSTWTTVATQINNNTGSLTLGLNTSNVQSGSLTGFVPMGYYMRLSSSGTSSFSYVSGMEVLL